jgi:hypothetical protein
VYSCKRQVSLVIWPESRQLSRYNDLQRTGRMGFEGSIPGGGREFFSSLPASSHVRWVPCHHGMARPQVVDGGKSSGFGE